MRSRPAYSLIFAFLVMTVILIIASTTIENTNEKITFFREMEGSTQAKLAAESAVEDAVLEMKDYNAGYSIDLTSDAFTADLNGDGVDDTHGDYTVYSNAQTNDTDGSGLYYTPIPGTGTAGDPDSCSILNDDEDVDHPCNWNKLMYGDTVSIPLYSDDGSGGISTPSDLGFNAFYLKVRTPCMSGDLDTPSCTRFTFDETDSDPTDTIIGGDSVVFWQIVGTDLDGNTVSLIPDDKTVTSRGSKTRNLTVNTEIYEKSINDAYDTAGDYIVLDGSSSASNSDPYGICSETDTGFSDGTWNGLSTLSLQLNIVTPLLDSSGDPFPYLEWQLSTDSTDPFADTKAVIVGEGYYEGQDRTFYYPFVVTRSTTGESTSVYTLSN